MTLREWSALLSTILVIVGTAWYLYLAVKGTKVRPVLASWIVLSSTMTLSFATYWTSPNRSLVSNACNAVSVVSTLAILITALVLQKDWGKITFSPVQKWSLGVSGVIAALWIFLVWGMGSTGVIPNVLTQVLMTIGYFLTIEKVWNAKQSTESLFTWWCITFASAVALYTALVSADKLATIYATRAAVTSGILVFILHRVERKSSLRGIECAT